MIALVLLEVAGLTLAGCFNMLEGKTFNLYLFFFCFFVSQPHRNSQFRLTQDHDNQFALVHKENCS